MRMCRGVGSSHLLHLGLVAWCGDICCCVQRPLPFRPTDLASERASTPPSFVRWTLFPWLPPPTPTNHHIVVICCGHVVPGSAHTPSVGSSLCFQAREVVLEGLQSNLVYWAAAKQFSIPHQATATPSHLIEHACPFQAAQTVDGLYVPIHPVGIELCVTPVSGSDVRAYSFRGHNMVTICIIPYNLLHRGLYLYLFVTCRVAQQQHCNFNHQLIAQLAGLAPAFIVLAFAASWVQGCLPPFTLASLTRPHRHAQGYSRGLSPGHHIHQHPSIHRYHGNSLRPSLPMASLRDMCARMTKGCRLLWG